MRNETLLDLSFLPERTVETIKAEILSKKPNARIRDADVVVALQSAYHRHHEVAAHNPINLTWRPSVFKNPAIADVDEIIDTAKHILMSSSSSINTPTQSEYAKSLRQPTYTRPALPKSTGGRVDYTSRNNGERLLDRSLPMRSQS